MTKKTKRWMVAALSLALGAGLLTGCGGAGNGSGSSAGSSKAGSSADSSSADSGDSSADSSSADSGDSSADSSSADSGDSSADSSTADSSADSSTADSSSAADSGDGAQAQTEYTPALDTETAQTITVLGEFDNFEALEAAGAAFREYYPNVEVVYEKLDDYNNNIRPRVASDTNVGIFMINGYNLLDRYASESGETLLDFVANIEETSVDLSQVDEYALKSNYVDGILFGIPLWYRYRGIVINEDLLADAGLEAPQNLTEFEACCDTLIEKGYVPMHQTAKYLSNFYIGSVMKTVADMEEDAFTALVSGEDGSADALVPVFEKIFEHKEKGYITDEIMEACGDGYNDAILEFFEGDAPFLVVSSSTVSGMQKRETKSEAFQASPFSYSFLFAPNAEDGMDIYVSGDTGFALNKNCTYYDMAEEFYRFIYTEEILNQFAEIKRCPSVAAHVTGDLYQGLSDIDAGSLVTDADINDPTGVIQDVWEDVAIEILTGDLADAEAAARRFEARTVEVTQEEG